MAPAPLPLSATSHLFFHRIAHLDLKLDNILVDNGDSGSPSLVLCDFGCAVRCPPSWEVMVAHIVEGNQSHRAPEVLSAVRTSMMSVGGADVRGTSFVTSLPPP